MATVATQVLGQNVPTVTLLGSDGAKLEIQRNGVMLAKSSGGRKIMITTAKAKTSLGAQGALGKGTALGKGALGTSAMDKAAMAKKITIMGENGARLEIKRNGLMLAKSAGGREIKIASAKTHPTVMGLGKASAGQGASAAKVTVVGSNGASLQIPAQGPLLAKAPSGGKISVEAAKMKAKIKTAGAAKASMAKAGKAKAGAAKMAGMATGKGGMTKAAMLKAATAEAALNPGREANVVAANGAKLELKRNGIIQMKTPDGKEVKIAANAKGKLAMLKGQGAVKTVAATKVIAPAAPAAAVAPGAAAPAAPPAVLAPKHAIFAHKGGVVLVNPQFFLPSASKSAAAAAKGAIAAKGVAATGAAATTTGLGLGLGLGALGPALLVGAAAITGFGIYGYVTRGRVG